MEGDQDGWEVRRRHGGGDVAADGGAVADLPGGEDVRDLGDLRRAGVAVEMAYKGKMKARMAKADALGARFAIIIGDDELAKGVAAEKTLGSGPQVEVAVTNLAEALR